MARYLQFTPPLHGLLQGFAIAPLVSRLGIRGASELGTLVPALCYPLWGSAWLVPGKLRRAAVYGTVQVLGVNTWMVMSKLGTEARMMNALPEGVGKGELSAAISSLQMAVNVSSAGNLDILDLGISDELSAALRPGGHVAGGGEAVRIFHAAAGVAAVAAAAARLGELRHWRRLVLRTMAVPPRGPTRTQRGRGGGLTANAPPCE